MLSINQLMRYLRKEHHISIKSRQTQDLRNMGYYHGYKGYRFIRTPQQRIAFTSFDEIIALNKFDMQLKSLFYPKVMFIENALKSYVIESVLAESKSENLETVFNRCITDYRSHSPGSRQYRDAYTKRMQLRGKINSALIRDYSHDQQIVNHFFDNDRSIPIWAIFESLTLGEFGTFFSCSNEKVKLHTSGLLHLPTNQDVDGKLTQYMIYTLKDLRNAVAHNNIIFDTRFQTGKINRRLITLLENETGLQNINFKYIDAYVILLIYILRKMKQSKTECRQFINSFTSYIDTLRTILPISVCNRIVGTGVRSNMQTLNQYIAKS